MSKLLRKIAGLGAPAPAAPDPYAFLPPYGGLKNEPGLPPFEQPGASLPMDRYMAPAPAPAPQPAPPVQVAAPPPAEPMPTGGQGWNGPDPMLSPAYDPMKDPRYLPEQWGGSFNPRWQG